jgi:hypothetical protein
MTDTAKPAVTNGVQNLPAIPAAPSLLPDADRAGRIMEEVVAKGDLKELSGQQRARYYVALCQSLGLNPMTKPFEYLHLNGKVVLYPNKGAAEQLGRVYRVSIDVVDERQVGDLWIVKVKATMPDGRSTQEIGAVPIKGKGGEDLANALMKALTKAKRRAVLSIVGLGWLDVDRADEGEPVRTDRFHNLQQAPVERQLAAGPADANTVFFGDHVSNDPQTRIYEGAAEELPPDAGEFPADEDLAGAIAEQAAPPAEPPPVDELEQALAEHAAKAPSTRPPSWWDLPLGKEISQLVDQLDEAKLRYSLPGDDASEADLQGWISSKAGLLKQRGAK